jgi:hypothetical protein
MMIFVIPPYVPETVGSEMSIEDLQTDIYI